MPINGIQASGGMKPTTPTIGTAADGGTGTTVSVAFTPSSYIGKGTIQYTATSSPGSLTATGSGSPLTVSGLTAGTAYTFSVRGTTNYGVLSDSSAASNSVTPAVPGSYESIATINGNGSSSILTFSNINALSASYKALQIRALWNFNQAGPATVQCYMFFNSDTALNYYRHRYYGNGSSAIADSDNGNTGTGVTGISISGVHSNEGPLGAAIIDVSGFNNTSKKTVVRALNGANLTAASADSMVAITGGVWNSTANVTSISFQMTSGRVWTSNTTLALYGIKG